MLEGIVPVNDSCQVALIGEHAIRAIQNKMVVIEKVGDVILTTKAVPHHFKTRQGHRIIQTAYANPIEYRLRQLPTQGGWLSADAHKNHGQLGTS